MDARLDARSLDARLDDDGCARVEAGEIAPVPGTYTPDGGDEEEVPTGYVAPMPGKFCVGKDGDEDEGGDCNPLLCADCGKYADCKDNMGSALCQEPGLLSALEKDDRRPAFRSLLNTWLT